MFLIGPRNFSGGTYDFSPVRPFVRNAFSPSLMSQIFWNLVYSLSGVKVRDCQSLFLIFAKFGPPGSKNGHFWPCFGHFCSFLDFKIFSESEIFLFFNMMFLGIFRSDLQKIVKKGSNFDPPGPKNRHFWPFFWPFLQFFGLRNFTSEWIFLIFYLRRNGTYYFWRRFVQLYVNRVKTNHRLAVC